MPTDAGERPAVARMALFSMYDLSAAMVCAAFCLRW